ncbi:MAG: ligase-associated DNA damage response DEXH box helicase [Devosiaceae bacterium]|nr:ligase-associated DNA damage response DEXH box helicase [Devosiaceae bacterium]
MSQLPPQINNWFTDRNWKLREHQSDVLKAYNTGHSTLLVAPTGSGKTLAGFLPTLVELANAPHKGLHTLYISPLKALAVDVARNLLDPISEMALDIKVETRTGDTPASKRQRQRYDPPQILLTTPEQLALLISHPDAARLFGSLRRIVLDELHALVSSKRGELLSLGLARLAILAPDMNICALSATIGQPDLLLEWIARPLYPKPAKLISMQGGSAAVLSILASKNRVPWAGHSASYASQDLYQIIKDHRTSLLFVNTRSQAENLFKELWDINEENLAIALHHGSLDVAQRRRIESAMVQGKLKAIVCTSTLDLGIDWGDVDLVMQIGAPKGSSRMLQRIGRSNHRLDTPSKAILVPSNRFEVLECEAALRAVEEGVQDSEPPMDGSMDVLAQHVLGMACAGEFDAVELHNEIIKAWPYKDLSWQQFERVVDFVSSGGYALRAYERYAKLRLTAEKKWRIANQKIAQQYRLNSGTIIEEPMVQVRLVKGGGEVSSAVGKTGAKTQKIPRGGRALGKMEEYFFNQLLPGDTFLFGGEILAFHSMGESEAYVVRSFSQNPKVPAYMGGKFPLSTYLAQRVRALLADHKNWHKLPDQVSKWLELQREFSQLPGRDNLLVETFPRADKSYLVCYPFEGRLAHQSLGMLLTRRLERMGARPLGFVASEYALAIWGLGDLSEMINSKRISLDELFSSEMLGDDLEEWLAESSLMRRTFRNCAMISGLIERRHPGKEKTGRQITMSSDLIYDVLYTHEPDHILIEATRREVARGLLDIKRLGQCLKRVKNRIVHKSLSRISPLAVPVMLEIGKEPIFGEGRESAMAEAADELIREASAS